MQQVPEREGDGAGRRARREGASGWRPHVGLTQQRFKGTAKRDVQISFRYHNTSKAVKNSQYTDSPSLPPPTKKNQSQTTTKTTPNPPNTTFPCKQLQLLPQGCCLTTNEILIDRGGGKRDQVSVKM